MQPESTSPVPPGRDRGGRRAASVRPPCWSSARSSASAPHSQAPAGPYRRATNALCTQRRRKRDCMKSGCRRVFRYSSTHEKEIPDGSIRRRMEPHRSPHARPHRTWTAEVPRPSRDPERRLLPPKERLPMATAPPRLPQVAHRLVVLQEMAHRRDLGAPQSGPPRTPQGALEARSSAKRRSGRFPVGEEYRGGRRRARLRRWQEGQGA